MYSLSEILFRLLAWLRPVLWYDHRLGALVAPMLRAIDDEATLLWLEHNPEDRADLEAKVADGEHCLDIAIALRACELLGWPIRPEDRPGIRSCARIHSAPSLERLAARVLRLAHRHADIERLARLRTYRLRREIAAADPLTCIVGWTGQPPPGVPGWWLWWWWWFFPARGVVFLRGSSPAPAGLRIRAPP